MLAVVPQHFDQQSVHTDNASSVHVLGQSEREEEVEVTCSSYKNYVGLSAFNYFLFPATFVTFLLSEVLNILYFRFLAGYEDLNTSSGHEAFKNNDRLFMGILGSLLLLQFLVFFIKYMMLQMVILFSNE